MPDTELPLHRHHREIDSVPHTPQIISHCGRWGWSGAYGAADLGLTVQSGNSGEYAPPLQHLFHACPMHLESPFKCVFLHAPRIDCTTDRSPLAPKYYTKATPKPEITALCLGASLITLTQGPVYKLCITVYKSIPRMHTTYTQDTHHIYTGYTPHIHRICTGYTQDIHRIYTGYTGYTQYSQGIHRVYTGYTQVDGCSFVRPPGPTGRQFPISAGGVLVRHGIAECKGRA